MMKMKIAVLLVLSLTTSILYAQEKPAKRKYLDVGSTLNDYPNVEWIKGSPVTKFEKDKIYIIELWATWCVPCIAQMPHLNELHNKFKNSNIVMIAQDIMEDDKSKVEKFVTDKGEGLTYKVAFSGGEKSDFDLNWVKPAGVSTIPKTFVIQNNILVWITTPDHLNENVLKLLMDGKFSIEAAEAMYKNK
jgi:thiol-disulfide isomerase/thioredoxin